jgi:hypothetical protein
MTLLKTAGEKRFSLSVGFFLYQEEFSFPLSRSDLARSTPEGQSPDALGFLFFHFPFRRTRSKRIEPQATPNSSCDDIWFVLAFPPDEVHSITPHHRTPHTRDTMKAGRDWPVMSHTRRREAVLHIDGNAVYQELTLSRQAQETRIGTPRHSRA